MPKRFFLNLLDINPRIIDASKKAKLDTPQLILSYSSRDILKATKLTLSDIEILQKTTAKTLLDYHVTTALELTNSNHKWHKSMFTTGCTTIDEFLRGGIRSQLLTEITGESGAGKSQLCLQLCITVQLDPDWGGLNAGAIYLSTECIFPSNRLMEMSEKLRQRFPDLKDHNFTDNVYVEHCADFENLKFCLEYKIPRLLKAKKVKLLVIDSVAAILRAEQYGEKRGVLERTKKIFFIIALLQKILCDHNIAVVLVNQVLDNVAKTTQSSDQLCCKSPALGLTWASLINCRIFLSRSKKSIQVSSKRNTDGQIVANIRNMEVMFSPYINSHSSCKFIVDEEGVKGIK